MKARGVLLKDSNLGAFAFIKADESLRHLSQCCKFDDLMNLENNNLLFYRFLLR